MPLWRRRPAGFRLSFRAVNFAQANLTRAVIRASDLRQANLTGSRGQATFDRVLK